MKYIIMWALFLLAIVGITALINRVPLTVALHDQSTLVIGGMLALILTIGVGVKED